MRRRRRNPTGWSLACYVLAGAGLYLLYRTYKGLSDTPSGYEVEQPQPPPAPTPQPIRRGTVTVVKIAPQPTQAKSAPSLAVAATSPSYLKFKQQLIESKPSDDIWSPSTEAPVKDAATQAMSLVLPVVSTPVSQALEESDYQRAYDIRYEVRRAEGDIESTVLDLFKDLKENSKEALELSETLRDLESTTKNPHSQEDTDLLNRDIVAAHFDLAKANLDINQKLENAYEQLDGHVSEATEEIAKRYGDEEAQAAKEKLLDKREATLRSYNIYMAPDVEGAKRKRIGSTNSSKN